MRRSSHLGGFGLIEVLVAGIILGIIGVGFMTFMNSVNKNLVTARVRDARDSVLQNLTREAGSSGSLKKSAQLGGSTSQLARCINSGGSSDCSHNVSAEFNLYNVLGQKVAGTTANPERYTTEGAHCAAASSQCPLEAISSIKGICFSGSNCDVASQISVTVTLRQAASVTSVGGNRSPMSAKTFTTTLDVKEINGYGAQTCPTNQVLTGIDADGKIICSASPASDHFGGAWACQLNTSTLNCGPCLSANPMTGGCSCGSGYTTIKVTGCNASLYRCGFVCVK